MKKCHVAAAWSLLVAVMILTIACGSREEPAVQDDADFSGAAGGTELALLMGEMQRHSSKLGYSIAAGNRPLARFYLEELEETLSEVIDIEEHDGFAIGKTAGVILQPTLAPLMRDIDGARWDLSSRSYSALIDACNRCHAATEHEFIVILEPAGQPPYNQAF